MRNLCFVDEDYFLIIKITYGKYLINRQSAAPKQVEVYDEL